jgi:cytochrome c-type biogenesis protein CcmE
MTRRQRRLILIGLALGILGVAAALVLSALRESIVFFHSPTEIAEKSIQPGTRIRIGGLVKEGSIQREGLEARFEVTDGARSLPVVFRGVLPDLFREGQGVVAEGALESSQLFRADTVLAKHDENYMPREVVDALKKQGVWKPGDRK